MRILAIRIKNLASLDGKTEIDFTAPPLASAGIFAITGPTGAGKSTLLDAICLALYAETPRYIHAENSIDIADVKNSTIKQGDPRGILRDGTSDGYAEVDFVAVDGNSYCAAWSVKRAHNRIDGNLQNYEMRLKNISTNQDIPGKKTEILDEIERLIGLSFEQFTRSVLLAQGDFTAFLKAGKDEKSSLLEKLTGTHIYSEISKRIYENHRQHLQVLNDLNLQRKGIPTLTPEELSELQEQKTALDATIKENTTQIAALRKEITWHEELQKLKDSVTNAKQQFEEQEAIKAASLPRENHLKLVTAIQPAGPVVRDLKNIAEQLATKSNQSAALISTLSILADQKKNLDLSIDQANEILLTEIQKEQDAIPALNRARALDVQLAEQAKQITQANTEAGNTSLRLEQHLTALAQIEKESIETDQKLAKLNDWKTNNESRKLIAEQEHLILSKLNDAEETLASLKHYTNRINHSEKEIESFQQQRKQLLEKKGHDQELLQQSQSDFDALNAALSDIDIADLENQQIKATALIEDLISGTAQWNLLQNATAEQESLRQSLLKSKTDLEHQANELTKTTSLLEVKRIEKETFSASLEKARLIAAASVEELRTKLEPGQPCPVCGSTSHPYTAEHPVLETVLLEMETNFRQSENEYLNLLTTHSGLVKTCSHLKEVVSALETNITHKASQVQDLENRWQALAIYKQANLVANNEVSNWLREQLQEQKINQQQFQRSLQSYNKQKEQLEKYRKQLSKQQEELNNTENEIKDVERDLLSFQEQKMTEVDEQKRANENLLNLKHTLSVYFPSDKWFQEWQTDSQKFNRRITDFSADWKSNINKIDECAKQQAVFAVKLKGMQENTGIIREELTLKNGKLTSLQKESDLIANERKSLFNGESTIEAEAKLKNAISAARQKLQEKKEEKEILQTKIIQHTTSNEQILQDIATFSDSQRRLKEELNEWLGNHNRKENTALTAEDLDPLLSFTQDWIEKERLSLRSLDDALIQAKSVLNERELKLSNHSAQTLSNRTQEEVINLEKEAQDIWNENSKLSHHIVFRINEDSLNKKQIGKLLEKIEQQSKVVENWSKLNEIIGSADGKKFRQTAQEYTLDLLLSYANVHLEFLSKRYVLQRIPNTLGLQVLDQDMGDEIRTVYSLSGGESFLVSLALALALASLSSSRMKVESLFIDEGFGSLDPTTLNIAMDALERLHNQGRKVGVISHVQEMTDRIPVQIKVSKQQSGKSKVEIIS